LFAAGGPDGPIRGLHQPEPGSGGAGSAARSPPRWKAPRPAHSGGRWAVRVAGRPAAARERAARTRWRRAGTAEPAAATGFSREREQGYNAGSAAGETCWRNARAADHFVAVGPWVTDRGAPLPGRRPGGTGFRAGHGFTVSMGAAVAEPDGSGGWGRGRDSVRRGSRGTAGSDRGTFAAPGVRWDLPGRTGGPGRSAVGPPAEGQARPRPPARPGGFHPGPR